MEQNIENLSAAGATFTTEKGKRRGRKPLPPEQVRKRFGIPFSLKEYDQVKGNADKVGIGFATFVRMASLGQQVKVVEVPKVNKEIWLESAPFQTNLNGLLKAILNGKVKVINEKVAGRLIADLGDANKNVKELRKELVGK